MNLGDKAQTLLAQFPGPVRLPPSPLKWLMVFLIGAFFTMGGSFMIRDGEAMGWFIAIFFAVVAIVAVVVMLPNAGGLMLDADGFECRTLYRGYRRRWRDVANFGAALVSSRSKMVVFDDATAASSAAAAFSRQMTGRNAALNDTFGVKADDLAALMAQWRELALRD